VTSQVDSGRPIILEKYEDVRGVNELDNDNDSNTIMAIGLHIYVFYVFYVFGVQQSNTTIRNICDVTGS